MFDYRALFVWLKYRTYLRISIQVYCFYICGSGFGVLFWLKGNIRKQNHLTKYEKVHLCSLKCVNFCWYRQRINVFFFLKNSTLVWSEFFLNNYLFMRPESSKAILKVWPQIFWEDRYQLLLFWNIWWYKHLLTFNSPLQYADRLSNIIAT